LQDFGIEYAILGHSERRRYLAESSQLVADKVAEALKWKIKPILCLDKPYFSEQARFMTSEAMSNCLLAYEPVTAIGSGQAEAAGNLLEIRHELTPLYSAKALIYGGSVNAENVGEYLRVSDGVLLGGAALKLNDFIDLLYAAVENLS